MKFKEKLMIIRIQLKWNNIIKIYFMKCSNKLKIKSDWDIYLKYGLRLLKHKRKEEDWLLFKLILNVEKGKESYLLNGVILRINGRLKELILKVKLIERRSVKNYLSNISIIKLNHLKFIWLNYKKKLLMRKEKENY